MDNKFTLSELSEFSRNEIEIFNDLVNKLEEKEKPEHSPRSQVVQNILAYSKALSIRESKVVDQIEMVLN